LPLVPGWVWGESIWPGDVSGSKKREKKDSPGIVGSLLLLGSAPRQTACALRRQGPGGCLVAALASLGALGSLRLGGAIVAVGRASLGHRGESGEG